MKYVSLALLVLLLGWTWSLATSPRDFSLQQYKLVEAGVEEDIRGFIQRKYPNTSNIYCQQLYTEKAQTEAEMTVHFRCQATGPSGDSDTVEQTFEGHIRLKSDDGFKSWSETGGEISSPQVVFQKGIEVTPDKPAEPTATDGDKK